MNQEPFLAIITFGKRRQSSAIFGNIMLLQILFLPMILFILMLEKKMIARMGNGCGSCVEGKMAQDQLFMWIVDACLALYADVIFRLYYVIHFYNLGDYVIVMLPSPSHWGPDFVFLRVGLNIGGLQCLWRFFRLYIGTLTILLDSLLLTLHVLWKLLP